MGNDKNEFQVLNTLLKSSGSAIPRLFIDLDKLDKNIEQLRRDIFPNVNTRLVVKSLPSLDLLKYIADKLEVNSLMVFHQTFLTELSATLSSSTDVLLGKPMPIQSARYYFNTLPKLTNGFNPFEQIQWLVDSTVRIEQYVTFAKELDIKLRLNLEIDVGLRRGGLRRSVDLRKGLQLFIDNHKYIEFSGFMGYDPHIVKIPSFIKSRKKAIQSSWNRYNKYKTILKEEFPSLWRENLTFNGAGSPTVKLHKTEKSPLNDISAGSCLVKPTTFDIDTLTDYTPACFIATPVLKKFKNTLIPGLEKVNKLLSIFNRNLKQSFFIYGGYWKADFYYPEELTDNRLYGYSTNQMMVNAPSDTKLDVDDFVFLRPHQSEFVFLQFGNILTIRDGKLDRPITIFTN